MEWKRATRVERVFCVGDPRELGNEKRVKKMKMMASGPITS